MRFKKPQVRYADTPQPATPYQAAGQVWDKRIGSPRVQAKNWRLMAFGCLTLALLMAGGGVALGAIHRDALRRGGGQHGPGTRRGRSRHAIPAQRCADRAPHRALRDAGALAVHRPHRRPPELAGRLRLHDRQGRGRAQRLRTGQRPVRAHRQGVGDGADHQRRARQRHVFQRALDGTPLRQRRRGGLERWTAVVSIVLQPPRTEERLRKNPWASTSTACRGAANWILPKEPSHE